jgi:predicted alpha/beta hydrolase family esterase
VFLRNFKLDFTHINDKGWKDDLKQKLENDYEIIMPRMPNSWNAKYIEWKIWFEKYLPYIRDNAIFIGNSLGAIFLAKYFSEHEYTRSVKGIFLLAAPYESPSEQDSLADFILPADMSRLTAYGDKVHLYHSADDPVVPFTDLKKYQDKLPRAQVRALEDRGHFIVAELPELVEDIQKL